MSPASTAIRVLSTPEILNCIFDLSNLGDVARCARTCQSWNEIALDHVWQKSPPLLKLLEILAPLLPWEEDDLDSWPFTRMPTGDDWNRFMNYSRRVKGVSISYGEDDYSAITFIAALVASDRSLAASLPSLQDINVNVFEDPVCPIRDMDIDFFLHGGLKSIGLGIHGYIRSKEMKTVLEEIAVRSPNITTLQYYIELPSEEVKDDLTTLLPKLRYLETLRVSPNVLSANIMDVTSTLPNLRNIDGLVMRKSGRREERGEWFDASTKVHSIQMPKEQVGVGFPALRVLLLGNALSNVTHFFQHENSFANLRKFSIEIGDSTTTKIQACLGSISSACPRIQKIKIFQTQHSISVSKIRRYDKDMEPINFQTLSLLPSFPHLTTFKLEVMQLLDIEDDELACLLNGCKKLTTLWLKCRPLKDLPVNISPTIAVLSLLAQKEISLKKLSLLVDARTRSLPRVTRAIQSIETMDFGRSPVHMSNELLMYLDDVLPDSCKIEGNPDEEKAYAECSYWRHHYYRHRQSGGEAHDGNWPGTWKRIADCFSFVKQIRLEEGTFSRLLADEGMQTDEWTQT